MLVFAWAAGWASNQQIGFDLTQKIKSEISSHRLKNTSFEILTRSLEKTYGTQAFQPLIRIALDRKNPDPDRYIALMSAAKLGGTGATPSLLPFLHDSSWMLRGGALRALSVVGNAETGQALIPLLRDPALVVRVEAVDAIRILKPKGAADALVATLTDSSNYHAGKAQWVPQKALLALTVLRASEAVPKIKPILDDRRQSQDPEFKRQLQQTVTLLSQIH